MSDVADEVQRILGSEGIQFLVEAEILRVREVLVHGVDEHSRPRRMGAEQRQIALADPPEMQNGEIESA